MDPISAISVATSILTFIEFSWAIVTGTYEVYKSANGTTFENAHVVTVIDDLEKVTEDLSPEVEGKTKHSKALCQLAEQCAELSKDLLRILHKLQATDEASKWQSLKVKLASLRKEKEISSIERRLDKYRSQILLRLNVMFTYGFAPPAPGFFSNGDYSEQQSSIKAQLDGIETETSQMRAYSAHQFSNLRKELDRAVQEALRNAQQNSENEHESMKDIRLGLSKLLSQARSIKQENYILCRLYFDSMYKREDTVADAESGTFTWIVEEDHWPDIVEDEDRPSTSLPDSMPDTSNLKQLDTMANRKRKSIRELFLQWLEIGQQIYHISGKAGSGKSTLMKFLSEHSAVHEKLTRWANSKKLVVAHFFFWNSGDELQMSLEGLYRSLLFAILKQCPELIPQVFSEEWGGIYEEGSGSHRIPLRWPSIKRAFGTLVESRSFPEHRFCFFIDGLDEYDGDSVQHWELAHSLRYWATSADIKICVSSRPHTEFMSTFSNDPAHQLSLHEVTSIDIRRFAVTMFRKSPHFERIREIYMDLVTNLVERANGVFLWARLVVHSLLDGVGHRYSHSALMEKLDAIPTDLGQLFDTLLAGIDPSDRRRSAKMFLIATTFEHEKNALIYSWLEDLEDPTFPFSSPVRACSNEEVGTRHEDVYCQLDSLSRGLLEVVPSTFPNDLYFKYNVQFFHRSVRDYLEEPSRQEQMRARNPTFNCRNNYFRLRLAEFKFARTRMSYIKDSTHNPYNDLLWRTCDRLTALTAADQSLQFAVLDDLEHTLQECKDRPFSDPEETRTNPGRILWRHHSILTSPLIPPARASDFSFLFILLSSTRLESFESFIQAKMKEDRNILRSNDGLHLLLLFSIIPRPEMVRFFLENGATPADPVVLPGPLSEFNTAGTFWMVYLCLFEWAYRDNDLSRRENLCLVLEMLLKYPVDIDVSFQLFAETPIMIGRALVDKYHEVTPCASISLKQLLRMLRPSNYDSIQPLILQRESTGIWDQATRAIAKFNFWNPPPSPPKSQHKSFEGDLADYKLHSLFSNTTGLQMNFLLLARLLGILDY